MAILKKLFVVGILFSVVLVGAPPKPKRVAKKAVPAAQKATNTTPRKPVVRKKVVYNPYMDIQQEVLTKDKFKPWVHTFVRMLSGIVPLGLAGAGTHQILSGNIKTGAALVGGALAATVGRAVWLRKRLQDADTQFQHAIKDFLEQWPTKRETLPRPIQIPFDGIYKHYRENDGKLNGDELVACAYSLDAWKTLEKVKDDTPLTEYQKCVFLSRELGSGASSGIGPLFFVGRMISDAFKFTYLDSRELSPVVFALHFAPLFFSGALRRYATGSVREKDFSYAQRQLDAARINTEWPAKLLDPVLHRFGIAEFNDKQIARSMGAVLVSMISVMIVKMVAGLIQSGFIAYSYYEATLLKLDAFVGIWPSVKQLVPSAFHEQFDQLYGQKFDAKTGRLIMSNSLRAGILKKLKTDLSLLSKKLLQEEAAQKRAARKTNPVKKG